VIRTLIFGNPAAPQPTNPDPEFPGPNNVVLAIARVHAHARRGTVIGSKCTVSAGNATGTMPLASVLLPTMNVCDPISGPMFSVPTAPTLVSTALLWF
jgi:hypothetical protein